MIENHTGYLHKGTYSAIDKEDLPVCQNRFQELINIQRNRVKKTAELADCIVDRILTAGCLLFVVGLILMPTPLGVGLMMTGIVVSAVSVAAFLLFESLLKKQNGELDKLLKPEKIGGSPKNNHKGAISLGNSEKPKREELVDLEIYKTYMEDPQSTFVLGNMKDRSPNAVRNLLFHRQKLKEELTQVKILRERGADSSAIGYHQAQIKYHLVGLSSHVERDKVLRGKAIQES